MNYTYEFTNSCPELPMLESAGEPVLSLYADDKLVGAACISEHLLLFGILPEQQRHGYLRPLLRNVAAYCRCNHIATTHATVPIASLWIETRIQEFWVIENIYPAHKGIRLTLRLREEEIDGEEDKGVRR